MTSSWHHLGTVTEWGAENRLRMIFFCCAGYSSFHRKESMRVKHSHKVSYTDEQDLEEQQKWCLIADWNEKIPPDSGFLLEMEKKIYCLYVFGFLFCFFFLLESYDLMQLVSCDLPLVEHGTEMFTHFMLWILAPFPASFVRCYFTQANAFRGKFFYISTIYWMANFIFFKSGLELVFSDTSSEKEISASCEAGRYF